jgi:hypothetical protein
VLAVQCGAFHSVLGLTKAEIQGMSIKSLHDSSFMIEHQEGRLNAASYRHVEGLNSIKATMNGACVVPPESTGICLILTNILPLCQAGLRTSTGWHGTGAHSTPL